ncbi:MAG: hypothetical protein N2578_04025 [Bdellovibrionaceae bacterium]|nr:hypothetical protein [Pseudobdellovibrionaceae bacterium]
MCRAIFYFLLVGLVSSCSLDAAVISSEKAFQTKPVQAKGQSTGVVSGSKQAVTTVGGYRVDSSVGNFVGGQVEHTTSGGYKVTSSIQGSIIN